PESDGCGPDCTLCGYRPIPDCLDQGLSELSDVLCESRETCPCTDCTYRTDDTFDRTGRDQAAGTGTPADSIGNSFQPVLPLGVCRGGGGSLIGHRRGYSIAFAPWPTLVRKSKRLGFGSYERPPDG